MAYRLSIWIVLFLISFNAGAVMLDSAGVDDYLGISTELGDTSAIEQAQDTTDVQTGTGTGSTLFGTYNRLTTALNTFFNAIMPGAEMMKNAGVPAELVNFTFSVLVVIPVIDLIRFLRGI